MALGQPLAQGIQLPRHGSKYFGRPTRNREAGLGPHTYIRSLPTSTNAAVASKQGKLLIDPLQHELHQVRRVATSSVAFRA